MPEDTEATLAERDALSEQLGLMTRRAEDSAGEARRLRAALDAAETTITADKEQIELRTRGLCW